MYQFAVSGSLLLHSEDCEIALPLLHTWPLKHTPTMNLFVIDFDVCDGALRAIIRTVHCMFFVLGITG